MTKPKGKEYRLNKRVNSLVTKNLRRLLADRKMTAEKLSFYSDFPKSNLSSLLNGKVNYTLRTLDLLARKGLECHISEFFKP